MSEAVADPEALRAFALSLRRFNDELQQQTAAIGAHLNQLNQTWRDEQQRRFADEFAESMRHLQRFMRAGQDHVPYLLRKADQIDAYLDR